MVNKITRTSAEKLGINFYELIETFVEDSFLRHRMSSSFYKKSIIEINEKHHPTLDKSLYGFWETNEYIWDDDHGFDRDHIDILSRVIQEEKHIIQIHWTEVHE